MIKIIRYIYNTDVRNTIGDLYLDDKFTCFTLEDERRSDDVKIYGKTALPAGLYKVKLTYSLHFKRELPLIYNNKGDLCVHGKDGVKWCGVRIHGGNTEKDTLGCILVGYNTDGKKIWGSAEKEIVEYMKKERDVVELVIQDKPFTYKNRHYGKE